MVQLKMGIRLLGSDIFDELVAYIEENQISCSMATDLDSVAWDSLQDFDKEVQKRMAKDATTAKKNKEKRTKDQPEIAPPGVEQEKTAKRRRLRRNPESCEHICYYFGLIFKGLYCALVSPW